MTITRRSPATGSGARGTVAVSPVPVPDPDPVRPSATTHGQILRPGPGLVGRTASSGDDPAVLAAAYGAHLEEFAWDHFVTLTTKRPTSPAALRAEFLRFVRRLERVAQGPVAWFCGIEGDAVDERPHVHALLAGTARLTEAEVKRCWHIGNRDVRVYDPTRGAARYVSKDIGRGPDHYDVSTRLPPRLPAHRRAG